MHYTSQLDLARTCEAISLEAMALPNMVGTISKYFGDFTEAFGSVAARVTGLTENKHKPDYLRNLSSRQSAAVEGLKKFEYETMTGITVPVPEGFKGSLTGYTTELQDVFKYYRDVSLESAQDYYVSIAAVVSNKNSKISLNDNTRVFRELQRSREKRNEALSIYFTKGSTQAGQKYGDVFRDKDAVGEFFQEANDLQKVLDGLNLGEIKSLTDKIRDTLAVLVRQAEEATDARITPEVARNLADGAYEIARHIEFFAVNHYRAIVVVNTAEAILDRIEKRLKA